MLFRSQYDDVTVGCHNLDVPAVAPELTHRTLRTALAEEEGRVLLGFIEIRWCKCDDRTFINLYSFCSIRGIVEFTFG